MSIEPAGVSRVAVVRTSLFSGAAGAASPPATELRVGRNGSFRRIFLARAVSLYESIKRCAVDARDPRGLRHVSTGPIDDAREVSLLEIAHQLFARGVVAFLEERRWYRGFREFAGGVLVEGDVGGANWIARFSENCKVFDDVLQLPNISAPLFGCQ